jgi:hypothetical protein
VGLGVSSDIASVNEKLFVDTKLLESDILFDAEKTFDALKGNEEVKLRDFDSDCVKLKSFV